MRTPLLVCLGLVFSTAVVAACGGDADVDAPSADPDASTGGVEGGPSSGGTSSPGDGGAGGRSDGAAADSGTTTIADAAVDVDSPVDAGPKPIVTSTFLSTLSGNEDMACGVTTTAGLRCWGANRPPIALGGGHTWKSVSVGGTRLVNDVTVCALRSDDTLWCWSAGVDGEIGGAGAQPDASPFSDVFVAPSYRCAVAETGGLYCWGINSFGALGFADGAGRATPSQVGTDLDWKTTALGNTHTCGLKVDGSLYCWGWGAFGDVGDGSSSTTFRTTPVAIDVGEKYRDISVRGQASCGIKQDGSLMCWGTNGEMGVAFWLSPTAVDSAKDWAKVRLSTTHACALKTTGALYCWGSNARGQLALPVTEGNLQRTMPTRVGLDTDWEDVAVGNGFTCATKKAIGAIASGTVWCWGNNGRGQLAQDPVAHLAPTRIGSSGEWSSVSSGPNNTCAVRKNGTLACWGRAGPLATAGVSVDAPVAIGAATDWKTAKPGNRTTCGTKTNDTLHCWANGAAPAATGLTVTAYDVGFDHQCAISAGSLYCWGAGIFQKLGNGSNLDLAAPTKVGADTWTAVGLASGSTCGVKANGALVCFGFGYTGFKTQGSSTAWTSLDGSPLSETYFGLQGSSLWRWDFASVLSAAGAENDWVAIAAGDQHACGIRTGGTLWCRGGNEQGQLGDGTLVRKDSAVQVGAATDWTGITAAGSATCGIRSGGDLYCWGSSDYGENGDGLALYVTPTVVP